MITRYYNCEFLSDIVLNASSNTQGNVVLSDFVAGSNFLGMVAKYYDEFKNDAFDVFHSGDVRFGDAHIVIDDKGSFKTPLSFHSLKVGTGFFNRIHLSDDEEKKLRDEQKQLKQIRTGFINSEFKTATPNYSYSQKSSYDKENRKSRDSGMFGYSALKKGTNWLFKIEYKDEKHIQKIEEKLLGKQKLGKSKSSQHGQVEITKSKSINEIKIFTPKDNLTYIYLNSRVCLMDEDGNFTAKPTIKNLGLDSGEIVWEKTYIKSSTYIPYNYKRQTKEYTRVFLNKGSVITIKDLKGDIKSCIGAFLSEGFGDILINPYFLETKNPPLQTIKEKSKELNSKNYDNNLITFLQQKEQKEQDKFDVASDVQNVYKKLIGPSKSQWGEIRTMASVAKNKEQLIQNITEYINHGKERNQWEDKQDLLFTQIQNSKKPIEFTKLLAMIVSKHTKGGKDAN